MPDQSETLHRFVEVQNRIYESVLQELRNGRKVTHWMWYIFPQIASLGFSFTAKMYALQTPGEVQAYLDHSTLDERLLECTKIVLAHEGKTALDIFGDIDAMKFRSSMTLFAFVAGVLTS